MLSIILRVKILDFLSDDRWECLYQWSRKVLVCPCINRTRCWFVVSVVIIHTTKWHNECISIYGQLWFAILDYPEVRLYWLKLVIPRDPSWMRITLCRLLLTLTYVKPAEQWRESNWQIPDCSDQSGWSLLWRYLWGW